MNDVVVSAECPTCGAPLDFAHGTTALHCDHCRSNLLVTGRKRALAYWIAPTITVGPAISSAKQALGAEATHVRIGATQLYFVPYYHLLGHELRWEHPAPPVDRDAAHVLDANGSKPGRHPDDLLATIGWASGLIHDLLALDSPLMPTAGMPDAAPALTGTGAARAEAVVDEALVFHDRYVDRSLLASELPGFGVESLGVRASVVRLALFKRSDLEALGRVVPVDVSADAALALGMAPPDPDAIVHRAVLARALSVIYFPFWCLTIERANASAVAVVDAVADSVVTLGAPATLLARLDRPSGGEPEVVGFRPLVCPNCGWDFPVRPDDVVFCCRSCSRAWQIRGTDLDEVPASVAQVKALGPADAARYLPCWVIDADVDGTSGRYFSPAFRARRLKALSDLARRLSGAAPTWEPLGAEAPELHGAYYDLEDAIVLARFTARGLARPSLAPRGATLTWFPFSSTGRELCDPFTGLALPENVLA